MKRIICVLLVMILVLLMTACTGKQGNLPISEGYLPTRMEQILTNSVIPEDAAAKVEPVADRYTVESLWGSWVRKDADSEDAYTDDPVFDYTISKSDGSPLEMKFFCFPEEFTFMPDYATSSVMLWSIKGTVQDNNIGKFGTDMPDEKVEYERNPLGLAFCEQGLGFGTISYRKNESQMDPEDLFASLMQNTRTVTYAVHGDVLAIGLTDMTAFAGSPSSGDEIFDQTEICEIDYTFSWNGRELTLFYDGQSAVYVPYVSEGNPEWSMREAGLINGAEPLDNMLGITLDGEHAKVMYELHSGYTDSEISVFDDGTMEIDGRVYSYACSDQSLTLMREGKSSVYSNYTFSLESSNNPAYASFLVDGNIINVSPDATVGRFIEKGFWTEVSLDQLVASGKVTDELLLRYGDSAVRVKACNAFDQPIALKDCAVCQIIIDGNSGAISKGDGKVGATTYERAESWFAPAYEKKPDLLRYRASYSGILMLSNSVREIMYRYNSKMVINLYDSREVVYRFSDGILQQVEILVPTLLYNGLQDNINIEVLENMDAATMQGYIENRDTVLERLKAAFDEAGIAVEINELTGEIVMSNKVLFGFDSAELSDEGRKYIDSFMGVYANVILDESLADVISKIQLEGHTDSSGSYSYNLKLSDKRAQAVLDYCVSSGSDAMNQGQKEKFSQIAVPIGYAFTDLVYNANGEEDAEASRRVSIKFHISEKSGK